MTPDIKTLLINVAKGAIAGAVPTALADYGAFKSAAEKDPNARFSWRLALIRWGYGAACGAATVCGFSAMGA